MKKTVDLRNVILHVLNNMDGERLLRILSIVVDSENNFLVDGIPLSEGEKTAVKAYVRMYRDVKEG